MTKEMSKLLSGITSIFLLGISFYLYQTFFSNYWWMLFVLLIISITIPVLLFPIKKTNKKLKKKDNKKLKASNISKSTKADKNKKLRSDNEILALPLEELSWEEFEQLCYLFFKTKGYKTEKTKKGADGGIDLIYYNKHHQQNVAVQIKHYIESGKPVTVKEIRELDSSKKNYKCVLADFISSTGYTRNALIEADNRHIKCHAVDKIMRWKEEEARRRKIS